MEDQTQQRQEKHRLGLVFLLLLIPMIGYSQIGLGLHFGPSCTSVFGVKEWYSTDSRATSRFFIGAQGIFPVGEERFQIQLELNYVGQGFADSYSGSYRDEYIVNFFQIGGAARYNFLDPDEPLGVVAFFGPAFDIGTGIKVRSKYNGRLEDVDTYTFDELDLKTFDVKILLGGEGNYLVMDQLKVFSQLRYNIGLFNINRIKSESSLRSGVFTWTVGARWFFDY